MTIAGFLNCNADHYGVIDRPVPAAEPALLVGEAANEQGESLERAAFQANRAVVLGDGPVVLRLLRRWDNRREPMLRD